jgi:hypothetical protein
MMGTMWNDTVEGRERIRLTQAVAHKLKQQKLQKELTERVLRMLEANRQHHNALARQYQAIDAYLLQQNAK